LQKKAPIKIRAAAWENLLY